MSLLHSPRLAPWFLLAPMLVLGTIFYVVPIVFSVGLGFTEWDALSPARWAGLRNYLWLISDPPFLHALLVTLMLAFGSAAIGVPAAFLLALAITSRTHRAVWRTIFWLPAITHVVAVAYQWQAVLEPTYGLVNRLLAAVGIAGPQWLEWPATAILSVAAAMAWITLGHNMLLFSTGLEAIDPVLFEAAHIDGASARQRVWHVTLPLLKETTVFVLITTLISGMSSFALILVMTEGGPDDSTTVATLSLYRIAFESLRLGRASAAAMIVGGMMLLVAILQLRWFRRGDATAA